MSKYDNSEARVGTEKLHATIAALEDALRNTLSLLPASIATNFNEDGTHNDSAYDIISNAHNLLENLS
jgi:hypothetical protein